MNASKRAAVGCLVLLGLIVAVGVLVMLNRDRVAAQLDVQAEKARATLFRLGEVMSISSALKAEYNLELDAGYVTSTGSRILRITCTDCDLPTETTAEAQARRIAVSAIEKTTKLDQIDTVEIVFRRTAGKGNDTAEPYSFALGELTRDPGH